MFTTKFAVLFVSGAIKMETCICDCGCKDPPQKRDWMCKNCSGQIHLGDRKE